MESEDIFFIIIGIIYILILLITTLFSSIIIIIIISHWHSHCRSISNLLICNSCTAFLIFVLSIAIQIPYVFQTNQKEENYSNTTFCRFRACFYLFCCITKMLSYLIQAISRYFITVLHKHPQLLTYRTNIIMILLNWILGIIIACGFLISPIGFQYESESHFCTLTSKVFHTSFTLMAVAFIIPVNIIIVLYVLILKHTTHTNRVQPNIITRKNNKRNLKVYRNILMLLGIVLIGGTPCLLCILINKFSTLPSPLYSISILFIMLSAGVESITIFLTNKDVKRIAYAKIRAFQQAEEMQTFTITLSSKAVTNHNGMKKIPKIIINA